MAALAAKDDETLLKPHPAAPNPFPPVPIGVTVQLSHDVARACLSLVPRLQKKHYEMIPRRLSELDFWVSAEGGARAPSPRQALPLR